MYAHPCKRKFDHDSALVRPTIPDLTTYRDPEYFTVTDTQKNNNCICYLDVAIAGDM